MSPTKSKGTKEIPVLVTTAHKGVFFGYAVDTNSKTIALRGARNCLYWPSEVGGFMGLASAGPNKETRVGPAVDMTLHDVTAVVKCTDAAEKAWLSANWKF